MSAGARSTRSQSISLAFPVGAGLPPGILSVIHCPCFFRNSPGATIFVPPWGRLCRPPFVTFCGTIALLKICIKFAHRRFVTHEKFVSGTPPHAARGAHHD